MPGEGAARHPKCLCRPDGGPCFACPIHGDGMEGAARPESRCWRCDQPKSRHVPGPPVPPQIKGHLGAVESMPGCCNAFQEPPADLEAQARMYRRQRDEYDREARRYRDALIAARKIIDRAVAEDNHA